MSTSNADKLWVGHAVVHRLERSSTGDAPLQRAAWEGATICRMISRAVLAHRQPTGADLVAVPPALAMLARRQAGVLTRRQLLVLGICGNQIRTAVRNRRWRTFGSNVVVLHNGALSPRQQEWVAVLLPDKPTALAGLSAAAAGGLTGFEPERVHVLVAHNTHVRAPIWMQLHESRRFTQRDIRRTGGLPRTAPARSFVDAATWSAAPRRACAILCASVQQRLITASRLDRELCNAGAIRHIRIMREIVGDISGGGHTLAEIDLGPLACVAGLPPPRRQALRRERSGRVRYVDAEFDLPDGTPLAVEIDGAVHLKPTSWWDDLDRQNELVIGGVPVLRFASLTVRLEPNRVIDQLSRMRNSHLPPRVVRALRTDDYIQRGQLA